MTICAAAAAAAAAKSKDLLAGWKITAPNAEIATVMLTSAKTVGGVTSVIEYVLTVKNAMIAELTALMNIAVIVSNALVASQANYAVNAPVVRPVSIFAVNQVTTIA